MWNNLDNSVVSTSGGFLNDSLNSNDENKKSGRRINKIIPVMVQHLMHSENLEGSIVTFIGITNQIEKSSTKVTYEIEDETGIKEEHFAILLNLTNKLLLLIQSFVSINLVISIIELILIN